MLSLFRGGSCRGATGGAPQSKAVLPPVLWQCSKTQGHILIHHSHRIPWGRPTSQPLQQDPRGAAGTQTHPVHEQTACKETQTEIKPTWEALGEEEISRL